MGVLSGFASGGLGFGVAFSLHDRFSATSAKIQKEFATLEGRTAAFEAHINRSMAVMKTGAGMMLGGAILAAPFIMATTYTMKFQEAMSSVRAVTQASAEDYKKLSDSAIELGKATKFTAVEASQGQYYLGLAGFTTNQILSAMPPLLSLASAGNMDLARTADIVSDTITAMGLAASDTTEMSDIMAMTITKSNTNIEQMGEALKYATASANNLGITMPVLSGMLGMLGDIGIKGSMAGTSLREMFRKMTEIGRTSASIDALKQLGMSMKDVVDWKGDLMNMTELLPKLAKNLNKIQGNTEQAHVISGLFGKRGSMAFAAFTKKTGKDFKAFVHMLQYDSEGMADKVAADMLDNLAGDLTKMKSMWEATMISLGMGTESALRPIIRAITSIIQLAGVFINTKLGKFLSGVAIAIAAVLLVTGLLVTMKGALSFVLMKAAKAFGRETAVMIMQTIVQKGVIAGMRQMAVAAWASLGPYALIAAAVLLIVWAMKEAIDMMSEGTSRTFTYGAALMMLVAGPIGGLIGVLTVGLKRGFKEFDEMKRDAFGNYSGQQDGILGFFQKIAGAIEGVMEIWKSWNGETFTLSQDMADKLEALGILDFVLAVGTWVLRIKEFLHGMKTEFVKIFEEVKPSLLELKAVFNFVFSSIEGWFESIGIKFGKNTSDVTTWADGGKMAARGLVLALKMIINPVGAIIKMYKWMWEKAMEYGHKLKEAGKKWIQGLLDGIKGKAIELYIWWIDLKNSIWDTISGLGGQLLELGKTLIANLWEGFKIGFEEMNPLNLAEKALNFLGIGGGSDEEKPQGRVSNSKPNADFSFSKPSPQNWMMPAVSETSSGGGNQVIQLMMDGDIVAEKMIAKNRQKEARK